MLHLLIFDILQMIDDTILRKIERLNVVDTASKNIINSQSNTRK